MISKTFVNIGLKLELKSVMTETPTMEMDAKETAQQLKLAGCVLEATQPITTCARNESQDLSQTGKIVVYIILMDLQIYKSFLTLLIQHKQS